MIRKTVSILFPISIAVWIISLVIHLLSACKVDILSSLPWLIYIQVIAFALLLSSILYLKWVGAAKRKLVWLIDQVPTLLIFLFLLGVPYCFANIFMAAGLHGTPGISEYDGYVLRRRNGTKLISEEEYHFYQALSMQVLSSASLAMSGIASFIFYPRK